MKAISATKQKASELAANPAVTEIVAATLVAAAAALRNPQKARAMAAAAADDLQSATKDATGRGAAFWQLALDVARSSAEALGTARGGRSSTKSGALKTPKKRKDKGKKKNKK